MRANRQDQAEAALRPKPLAPPPASVVGVVTSVRKAYKEQFETGLRLALEETQKGAKPHHIVEQLNARGLKTRTGRKWTESILRNELSRSRSAQASPPTPSASGLVGNTSPMRNLTVIGRLSFLEGPYGMPLTGYGSGDWLRRGMARLFHTFFGTQIFE